VPVFALTIRLTNRGCAFCRNQGSPYEADVAGFLQYQEVDGADARRSCFYDSRRTKIKRFFKLAIALIAFVSVCGAHAADADRGTAEDAIAMVKKVIADMKKLGKDKVIQDVQSQSPRYKDRDLYVFISNMDAIALANGNNPKLAGKSLVDIKDADGKPMEKERLDIARTKGKGWQDYSWPDPITKEVKRKSVYLEKYEDMIISCGIYKN
jgi:signal transduction histidine kinase